MTHNYDRVNYKNKYTSDSNDIRNQYRHDRGRPRYEQNYTRENFRGNTRPYQNLGRQNSREYRGNYRNENYSRDRGGSRSRERTFSRNNNISRRNNRSIRSSRSRLGPRASKVEIELDAVSVENMTISQKIVLHPKRKQSLSKSNKCLTWMRNRHP